MNTFAKRFIYCARIFIGSIIVAVCIGKWGKYNYPYSRNFISCTSHVLAFDCRMSVYELCILFVSWHGMYIDVTGPLLCNVTPRMQINANTKVSEIFPEDVFHACSLTEILTLHVLLISAVGWVILKIRFGLTLVKFDQLV
jgi:hypothetical protein